MISARSASLSAAAVVLIGTLAACFANGNLAARCPSATAVSHTGSPATNLPTISYLTGDQRFQPPAGAMAVRVRARPRRSSSKATQPPSELPTMCAVSHPNSSSWVSTWSARVVVSRNTDRLRGPPLCPAIVGANTSKRPVSASRGATSCHT